MESYTQQDEVDKLKTWWKSYGNSLVIGLLLGVGILFGNKYWDQNSAEQSAAASSLYEQLVTNIKNNNSKATKETSGKIISDYKSTPYAAMAALLMARVNFEKGDVASAQSQLQWAVDNATEDTLEHVARIRLARILLDQDKIKEASKLVLGVDDGDMAGYKAEYYEVIGDIYARQGNMVSARSAYQKAIDNTGKTSGYKSILSMKLDNSSEAKP
ncbi:MAG: tetratricopeptide repeat protein [Gammaproteobacteria bacterium]|nr:MAG: tetratricopeptide repeat protein [Gammaproteobacteria bacterium]